MVTHNALWVRVVLHCGSVYFHEECVGTCGSGFIDPVSSVPGEVAVSAPESVSSSPTTSCSSAYNTQSIYTAYNTPHAPTHTPVLTARTATCKERIPGDHHPRGHHRYHHRRGLSCRPQSSFRYPPLVTELRNQTDC